MFDLVITDAGLDALVDAQNGDTDAVMVTQIGLTQTAFDPAPTLIALPGEFKRVGTVAGQVVAPNVIHMTAQDSSADAYDLRGFGLFLADGTLFATYGQPDPIFAKVSISLFLLTFNVRFSGDIAGAIDFGDSSFLNPPATETVRGVAELATQPEADAGVDDERIVTPKKLKGTLTARTATGADIAAGDDAEKLVTPAAIATVPQTFGTFGSLLGLGGAIFKTGTLTVSMSSGGSHVFPVAFPTACIAVLLTPLAKTDEGDEGDEMFWISGKTRTGFSVGANNDGPTVAFQYLAIGH